LSITADFIIMAKGNLNNANDETFLQKQIQILPPGALA
jgi:hypothetical protein